MINPQILQHYFEHQLPTAPSQDTIYRLLHGRGQCFPGLEELNIDRVGEYLLLDFYGEHDVDAIVSLCAQRFPDLNVVWQKRLGGKVIWSLAEKKVLAVREGDLSFKVQLGDAQNIGLFLDMAPVRARLVQGLLHECDEGHDRAEWRVGGEWLNLFSYTGSLSCALIKGGARRVMNVDTKQTFLQWSHDNHLANNVDGRSFMHLKRDALDFKPRPGVLYDGIICDPPQRQRDSFDPARHYPKLLRRLQSFLAPGGALLLTHNDPMVPRQAVMELCREHAPELEWRSDLPVAASFQWRSDDWRPTFLLLQKIS